MATTIENPWLRLPTFREWVLVGDRKAIAEFNSDRDLSEDKKLLVEELMPEPFIGNLNAPVLLLSNNPGAGKGRELRAESRFQERIRRNLRQQAAPYPFYYLDPEVASDPNGRWWERRVKWLIDYAKEPVAARPRPAKGWPGNHRRYERKVVARSILNVVFFPYPSVEFSGKFPELESQRFGFDLVRQAMERDAFIVFMRSSRRWEDAVPGLDRYKRKCQVENVQNPTVSPTNLRAFHKVVQVIGAELDKSG